jgi:DNA-binding HxlR family transcriptional regulator
MTPPAFEAAEREAARWLTLVALDAADSLGATETMLLGALRESLPFLAPATLRHEIRYLEGRGYLTLTVSDGRPWRARITAAGIDLVEYRSDCPPGIARPLRGDGI